LPLTNDAIYAINWQPCQKQAGGIKITDLDGNILTDDEESEDKEEKTNYYSTP
jgi:hypothetical protein